MSDQGTVISNAVQQERQRCAALAIAVLMDRGTCKHKTDIGRGWNRACWDINHRIMNPDAFLTQSPVPAMIQALQAVHRDASEFKINCIIKPKTLAMVNDALEQLKNPKEL